MLKNATISLQYFENNEPVGVFKPIVENFSEYMLQEYSFLSYPMTFHVSHRSFVFHISYAKSRLICFMFHMF